MKIKLPENYKSFYTVDDVKAAKTLIASLKESPANINFYLEMAIRSYFQGIKEYTPNYEILSSSASTFYNGKLNIDRMCEGSGCFDVYISCIIYYHDVFIDFAFALSDIWEISDEYTITPLHCYKYTRAFD